MGTIYGVEIGMMAILLRKDNEKIYFSDKGPVTEEKKTKADTLDGELNSGIQRLLKLFLKMHLITKNGRKKDALRVWYGFGKFLLDLANKYKIIGSGDEIYFWQAIYDHLPKEFQKNPPPKRFRQLSKNQYRKAAIMAQYPWDTIKKVGRWAVWNDILDNPKILNDKRILDWIVRKVIKNPLPHKEIRKFLYAVSTRLRKIDTSVLSLEELKQKLDTVTLTPILNS